VVRAFGHLAYKLSLIKNHRSVTVFLSLLLGFFMLSSLDYVSEMLRDKGKILVKFRHRKAKGEGEGEGAAFPPPTFLLLFHNFC
jgi:hypothetical protein